MLESKIADGSKCFFCGSPEIYHSSGYKQATFGVCRSCFDKRWPDGLNECWDWVREQLREQHKNEQPVQPARSSHPCIGGMR